MKHALLAFALLFTFASASAHKVIGIADGDTLTLLVDGHPLKVRLANVDAPEKSQAYGQRSKQSLSELCWGKDATYDTQTKDRYGRTVAVVRCNGIEVNRAQVERGMVWVYEQYNRDRNLPALQAAARSAHRGLWAEQSPLAPWRFRHADHTPRTRNVSACQVGPRGGRYRVVEGKRRYGCQVARWTGAE